MRQKVARQRCRIWEVSHLTWAEYNTHMHLLSPSLCSVNSNSTQLCLFKDINTIRKQNKVQTHMFYLNVVVSGSEIKIIIWTGHNYSRCMCKDARPLLFFVDF